MGMDDDVSISVNLPLDRDGFLRRECPTCEQEFKWLHSNEEGGPVSQYFCPLCGHSAGLDSWWTPKQLQHMEDASSPAIDQIIRDGVTDAFKGLRGMRFEQNKNFTMGGVAPDPLVEPDDMAAVEPPCHPEEPVKVPSHRLGRLFCLVCGSPFAAA